MKALQSKVLASKAAKAKAEAEEERSQVKAVERVERREDVSAGLNTGETSRRHMAWKTFSTTTAIIDDKLFFSTVDLKVRFSINFFFFY